MEGQRQDNISEEKEIDLLALVNKIWLKKKFILKVVGIGFIFGLVVTFSIPKEYTTTVVLVPDSETGASGSIGTIAAIAGFNIGSSSKDPLASPDLYPNVIRSTPFLKGLFNIKVKDANEKIDTTLYYYMLDQQQYAWWNYLLKIPFLLRNSSSSNEDQSILNRGVNTILSENEMDVILNLKDRISISSEKKTGLTTITITMQSSEISGNLADTLTFYLQNYIIDYRTQKAKKDLQYSEKLYTEAKENYYKSQRNLAAFIDANMNVVSAEFRTNQEKLQNEANLAYTIYNQMAQQLQMAKVKVQDTTPVFTIIEPAIQPLAPSSPRKKIIVIGILLVSFICSSIWILRKDIWNIIVNDIHNKEK